MASHKAIVSGLSGRYALALFELALEAKELTGVSADLEKLQALLGESDDFYQLVSSPLYGRDEQTKALAGVADVLALGDLMKKFLGVLAANRRLGIISNVIRDFALLNADHNGEVNALVTSAQPLSDGQLDELKSKLKGAMGRDVSIDTQVDESLLGGLIVKVGSRMVDSSLKTKLDNLKVAMKGVQ